MSRRVKTFDPKRPSYYGKTICTRDEFINRFVTDEAFLILYKSWQENDYKRKYAPSIDRIDNDKDYTLDNLRFTSHYENSTKDVKNKCKVYKEGQLIAEFESQKECASYIGICESELTLYFQGKKQLYSLKVIRDV